MAFHNGSLFNQVLKRGIGVFPVSDAIVGFFWIDTYLGFRVSLMCGLHNLFS